VYAVRDPLMGMDDRGHIGRFTCGGIPNQIEAPCPMDRSGRRMTTSSKGHQL
jgi:hypothetical protein